MTQHLPARDGELINNATLGPDIVRRLQNDIDARVIWLRSMSWPM